MAASNQQRKWVREEVFVLVMEYFRTKNLSSDEVYLDGPQKIIEEASQIYAKYDGKND